MSTDSERGLYVEADFLLALIKSDDWLQDRAEAIFEEYGSDLFTNRDTLVELMMVAYREDWHVERVVANAKALIEVQGDVESVLAAASFVSEHGMTPYDALHLVHSGSSPIVSSDKAYDEFTDRMALDSEKEE